MENSERAFRDFRARLFQLYQQGLFDKAVQQIDRETSLYPVHEARILNWRFCMLAASLKVEPALTAFREAIEKGFWYPVEGLRKDVDLVSLQGLPEFERLLAICDERHVQAATTARSERSVIQPNSGFTAPYPLLMVFHGRNANAADEAPYWQELAESGWLVALLQSSQVIGAGSYCWDDRDRAIKEALQHFWALLKGYPVDPKRLVLGGFSQGAGLVIWLTSQRIIDTAGFIAVSPYISEQDLAGQDAENIEHMAVGSKRGYLITGDQDEYLPGFDALENILQVNEIEFVHERHSGLGHEYPPVFSESLQQALRFIFKD